MAVNGSTIREVEVLVASPGRTFVTLRITTEDGVVGLGDATLNGRELSVAAYLRDHVAPMLVGRDAHRIEDTWQLLYRGVYWRRGPVTMTAISAVDVALWDIKARVAGLPLYQLLGGASRGGLLAYAHATGHDTPALIDSVRQSLDEGFRAVRVQTAVPGLDHVYGVPAAPSSSGVYDYEPAVRGEGPTVDDWDTRAYLRYVPGVFEAVRNEFGPELPLLHDAHHRLTPRDAAQLGKSLEPFDLFWLEDVTPADNQEALRLVRQHTTTPLAIGEVLTSVWDYQTLIREQLIDFVRSSVAHAGGITSLRRILDYAGMYQIRSGMHGATDISPVGQAAAMHLALAIHNFGIQEYMKHSAVSLEAFRTSFTFTDGYLHPGDEPGLGVEYVDEVAERHEYVRAYLPVNRLKDGTVHDW
ncbi:MAG: D-galactonate dehydratase family protein [Actinomycetales bacterium]|nr:D-galactonate dehydratase family protein [Actinomycetales bacterium]